MDPIKASSTTTRSRLLELPFEILIIILQFYCASLLSEQYLELIDNRFKVNLVAYSREVRSKKWTPSAPWYAHTFRGPRLYGTGVLYTSKTLWKAAQIAAVQMCHGSLSFETAGNNWQWPNRKNEFYQELGPILPFYLIREVSFKTGELESDFYPQFKWKKLTEFFNTDKWPILQKVVMRMDTPEPCGFEVWDVGALLRGEHDEELMECWTPYLPDMNLDDPEEICMHKANLTPIETKDHRNIKVELLVKDLVCYWIWDWGSYVGDEEDDSCFVSLLYPDLNLLLSCKLRLQKSEY